MSLRERCSRVAWRSRTVVTLIALALLVSLATPLAAAAGGTTVSVTPTEDSVDVGQSTTFEVVVDDADGGVGAAEIRVALDDASVAEITDVTVLGSGSTATSFADDGSYVDVEYAFRDTADTGSVTVLEVTVDGLSEGSTAVSLAPAAGNSAVLLFDESGTGYDVTGTSGATLDVAADQTELAPANFEVSDLQAPATATQGDLIDVSATVENTGEEAATKAVEFRVDTDGDGSITDEAAVASNDVSLDAGDSTTVTFSEVDTSELPAETLTHGVATPDDSATAEITLEAPTTSPAETTVRLEPAEQTVTTGQQVTYDVVVDGVDGGVGAGEFRVAVDDAAVAGSADVVVADDGSRADVDYAFRDTAESGTVTIAQVTAAGVSGGTTALGLEPTGSNSAILLFDENGEGYEVTSATGASVTVEPAPQPATFRVSNLSPTDVTVTQSDLIDVSATVENTGDQAATQSVAFRVDGTTIASQDVSLAPGETTTVTFEAVDTSELSPGEYTHGVFTENDAATATLTVQETGPAPVGDFQNPPTDPDGDGTYEDVNGDGTANVVDVQALFATFEDDSIQDNTDAFDFNGDGTVDVVDVQKLFTEVKDA